MEVKNTTVAVFIDAENISSTNADEIFVHASDYGNVIIKKIFGDWSTKQVNKWKSVIEKHSIVAEQQFTFVKGKNSCDISLIIQALLALFERDIDVFCLVSSDSDFTRLVQELRERKKKVVGMGTKSAPKSFVNAFSEFIYLGEESAEQDLPSNNVNVVTPVNNKQKVSTAPEKKEVLDAEKLKSLIEIIDSLVDENGKAYYAQISNDMKNKYSDFIPINYGCKTFKELIEKLTPHLDSYAVGRDGVVMYLSKK